MDAAFNARKSNEFVPSILEPYMNTTDQSSRDSVVSARALDVHYECTVRLNDGNQQVYCINPAKSSAACTANWRGFPKVNEDDCKQFLKNCHDPVDHNAARKMKGVYDPKFDIVDPTRMSRTCVVRSPFCKLPIDTKTSSHIAQAVLNHYPDTYVQFLDQFVDCVMGKGMIAHLDKCKLGYEKALADRKFLNKLSWRAALAVGGTTNSDPTFRIDPAFRTNLSTISNAGIPMTEEVDCSVLNIRRCLEDHIRVLDSMKKMCKGYGTDENACQLLLYYLNECGLAYCDDLKLVDHVTNTIDFERVKLTIPLLEPTNQPHENAPEEKQYSILKQASRRYRPVNAIEIGVGMCWDDPEVHDIIVSGRESKFSYSWGLCGTRIDGTEHAIHTSVPYTEKQFRIDDSFDTGTSSATAPIETSVGATIPSKPLFRASKPRSGITAQPPEGYEKEREAQVSAQGMHILVNAGTASHFFRVLDGEIQVCIQALIRNRRGEARNIMITNALAATHSSFAQVKHPLEDTLGLTDPFPVDMGTEAIWKNLNSLSSDYTQQKKLKDRLVEMAAAVYVSPHCAIRLYLRHANEVDIPSGPFLIDKYCEEIFSNALETLTYPTMDFATFSALRGTQDVIYYNTLAFIYLFLERPPLSNSFDSSVKNNCLETFGLLPMQLFIMSRGLSSSAPLLQQFQTSVKTQLRTDIFTSVPPNTFDLSANRDLDTQVQRVFATNPIGHILGLLRYESIRDDLGKVTEPVDERPDPMFRSVVALDHAHVNGSNFTADPASMKALFVRRQGRMFPLYDAAALLNASRNATELSRDHYCSEIYKESFVHARMECKRKSNTSDITDGEHFEDAVYSRPHETFPASYIGALSETEFVSCFPRHKASHPLRRMVRDVRSLFVLWGDMTSDQGFKLWFPFSHAEMVHLCRHVGIFDETYNIPTNPWSDHNGTGASRIFHQSYHSVYKCTSRRETHYASWQRDILPVRNPENNSYVPFTEYGGTIVEADFRRWCVEKPDNFEDKNVKKKLRQDLYERYGIHERHRVPRQHWDYGSLQGAFTFDKNPALRSISDTEIAFYTKKAPEKYYLSSFYAYARNHAIIALSSCNVGTTAPAKSQVVNCLYRTFVDTYDQRGDLTKEGVPVVMGFHLLDASDDRPVCFYAATLDCLAAKLERHCAQVPKPVCEPFKLQYLRDAATLFNRHCRDLHLKTLHEKNLKELKAKTDITEEQFYKNLVVSQDQLIHYLFMELLDSAVREGGDVSKLPLQILQRREFAVDGSETLNGMSSDVMPTDFLRLHAAVPGPSGANNLSIDQVAMAQLVHPSEGVNALLTLTPTAETVTDLEYLRKRVQKQTIEDNKRLAENALKRALGAVASVIHHEKKGAPPNWDMYEYKDPLRESNRVAKHVSTTGYEDSSELARSLQSSHAVRSNKEVVGVGYEEGKQALEASRKYVQQQVQRLYEAGHTVEPLSVLTRTKKIPKVHKEILKHEYQ